MSRTFRPLMRIRMRTAENIVHHQLKRRVGVLELRDLGSGGAPLQRAMVSVDEELYRLLGGVSSMCGRRNGFGIVSVLLFALPVLSL